MERKKKDRSKHASATGGARGDEVRTELDREVERRLTDPEFARHIARAVMTRVGRQRRMRRFGMAAGLAVALGAGLTVWSWTGRAGDDAVGFQNALSPELEYATEGIEADEEMDVLLRTAALR